ncbi:MAG: efflux RND transporter permease subunit [Nevskiaceae bacterium]|jgi:multidrug efflux pump subunit AcrB|nr:efflux RND transporter permease subunit [Nevskiaceae bacterium]
MNFVTWSIRNPVPVIMVFVMLVLGGVLSFPKLGVQDQPDISFPFIIVSVGYGGVPPSQMETEITRKVEDAISTIVGIKHINSTIVTGSSQTMIEFQFGTDMPQAMDDVRDAITRIRPDLPADALEPNIQRATTVGDPVLTFAVASDSMSDTELSWFVDLNVMRAISGVPGVGQVTRVGGVSREIRVDLDPDRMAALGVTAGDVSSQLVRTQVELPGGEMRIGAQEQNVRTLGTVTSIQELAALPISLGDGRNVRLDSLATVRDQAAEIRQEARLDGKTVIGFRVMRAWGEGAVKVADGARVAVKELQEKYPDIHITEINSVQDAEIRDAFHASMTMLVEGALLAIIVVWFFLRDIRATLISAAALPLSVIPTFWALHLFGFSMNTLTMLALTLVVGMLVDDAIVEVENIVRHLRMGKPPMQAATDAAIEIGLAVVATSLTLCAVFIPVAFMDGIPGQFFKPFGFTAAVAVLFSLLVARTLTPMMASRLMRPDAEVEKPGRFKEWYIAKVHWALAHRGIAILASTAVMVGTFLLATTLSTGFSPSGNFDFINLNVTLPPGSTMNESRDVSEQLRARLGTYPEVLHVYSTLSPTSASTFVTLTPRSERKREQQELQQMMTADLRNIAGVRIQGGQGGGPGSGPLRIELTGDDSAILTATAANIEREMREIPGLSNVTTSASLLQPELVIRPLPDRAAELGVSTAAISQATRIATSGDVTLNLAKMNLPDRQVPINVRLNDGARADINQIRLLQVPSLRGPVPLMNVADVNFGAGPSQITRYDRNRNITISADRGTMALGDANEAVNALPAIKNLPAGVRTVEAGDTEIMREIFTGFIMSMIIGILCIYALLVLLFHDMIQPITILSALPPSAGGAIVALWLLNMELSMPSLIGLLTLMGIVTKNSILLVEYIVMARRERGLSRAEAIVDACSKRARPIIMTTIAMAVGMLPITIGLHGDSSFRAPMGAAVIGGLLASTALSLFIVPVIYTLLDDFEHWLRGKFRRAGGGQEAVVAAPEAH